MHTKNVFSKMVLKLNLTFTVEIKIRGMACNQCESPIFHSDRESYRVKFNLNLLYVKGFSNTLIGFRYNKNLSHIKG